jgi:hypothetical protein
MLVLVRSFRGMRSVDAEDELMARLSTFGASAGGPSYVDVERTWQTLRAFADEPVEDVNSHDPSADTWFAQRGPYGGGTSVLDITREFRFADEEGHYSHSGVLSCGVYFAPFPDLKGLSAADLSSAGLGLDDFFRQALELPGYKRVREHDAPPKGLRILYTDV